MNKFILSILMIIATLGCVDAKKRDRRHRAEQVMEDVTKDVVEAVIA